MDVEEGLWEEVAVMETEDTLVAMIQFESGCTLLLKNCYAANMPDSNLFRIYGTRAGATLHPLVMYGESEEGIQIDTIPKVPADPQGGHVPAFEHFFECIRQGKQTESPAERSVITMRILDAIYTSAADGGREVRFDS
jgi:predicted dehydrogenase